MTDSRAGLWSLAAGPRDPKAHFRAGGGGGGGMLFCNTVEYGVLGVPKVVLVS